jgi:hypothetical protein
MPKRKRTAVRTDKSQLVEEVAAEPQPRSSGAKRTKASNSKVQGSTADKTKDGVKSFTIPYKDKQIYCERRGEPDSKADLIFTHGAGGGLSNPATALFADGFAEVSPVVVFQGTMNLKSRVSSFEAVVEQEDTTSIALGGRSMGARAAVVCSQQMPERVKALVLASYPLVGAQKGDVRDQILLDLPNDVDILFISGSNDSMCDMKQLKAVVKKMKASCWIAEVKGADHGMSLKSKAAVEPVRKYTGSLAAQWLKSRDEKARYCSISWDTDAKEVTSSGWEAQK